MTADSVHARVLRGGLIGAAAGVAWLALVLEVHAIVAPSADAHPGSAWVAGLVFGLFLIAPFTGFAGAVCGRITAGIESRRALRACVIGAIIAAALTLAWTGIRREERINLIGQRVWRFPGREPTMASAMRFNAQYNLHLAASTGAIAGAVLIRLKYRRRPH